MWPDIWWESMSTKSVGPSLIFLNSTRQTDRMADKSLGDSGVSPALCGQRGRTCPLMPRGRTNLSKNLSGNPILALKIIHKLPSEIKQSKRQSVQRTGHWPSFGNKLFLRQYFVFCKPMLKLTFNHYEWQSGGSML